MQTGKNAPHSTMTAPSKLAVEIAEAITRDILDRHIVNEGDGSVEDMQDAYDENEALFELEEKLAALIDAKLAPLVEDSGRLYKALNAFVTELERTAIVGSSSGDIHAIYCDARIALSNSAHFEGFEANGIAFEKAHAAIDQARAQRPAQEGSET